MTTGHYTILWHPYDPERYADLDHMWQNAPLSMTEEENAEFYAMRNTSPGWEDELHLLDLAQAEALLAAVCARIRQLGGHIVIRAPGGSEYA